jgi:ADP-heptose:LPS heptosyltransferase
LRLISFNREIQLDPDCESCKPGKKYIISDGFMQQLRENFSDNILEGIYPFKEISEKKYKGQDLTNKTLVVWRTGGMGDLCFITPNLRYIKETFKNSKIIFGCGPRFRYGMMNHPHIDKLVALPIDYDLVLNSDYYLIFEGIIEANEDAKRINAYDLFEQYFGFHGKISKEKKIPVLGLSLDHLQKQRSLLEEHKKTHKLPEKIPMVGLGLRASHIIRSISPAILHHVMGLLIQRGILVCLVGGEGDKEVADQLPLSQSPMCFHAYKNSKDFRDTIAHISLIDGYIGPDSSPIHMAAAFNKSIVGIYGPFPSKLRMGYYNNATGIDIEIACGPCFMHGIETCDYSDIQSKEPICMNSHQPELIVQEMLFHLKISSNKEITKEKVDNIIKDSKKQKELKSHISDALGAVDPSQKRLKIIRSNPA